MDKKHVLRELSFGDSVAENEISGLGHYFVETQHWTDLIGDDVDLVYGPKGSGKSAMYLALVGASKELEETKHVLLVQAENPRGPTAFQEISGDAPKSERDFISLWKLYFLMLIGREIRNREIGGTTGKELVRRLADENLLDEEVGLGGLLRTALRYIKQMRLPKVGVEFAPDPTGTIKGRIILEPAESEEYQEGVRSTGDLLQLAEEALTCDDLEVWIIVDRLDVAFPNNRELEKSALRALFRVYQDLKKFDRVTQKIFLRDDIWEVISEGFRESSHLTKSTYIQWDSDSLLNLIVRRLLENKCIIDYYGVEKNAVLGSIKAQADLLHRVLPSEIAESPEGESVRTWDWIITKVEDGGGYSAPREIIQLLKKARKEQRRRVSVGHGLPDGETLFESDALIAGLRFVSVERLKTLYREYQLYPEYNGIETWIEALAGLGVEEFTVPALAKVWGSTALEAEKRANLLKDASFFSRKRSNGTFVYTIPDLYRKALARLG